MIPDIRCVSLNVTITLNRKNHISNQLKQQTKFKNRVKRLTLAIVLIFSSERHVQQQIPITDEYQISCGPITSMRKYAHGLKWKAKVTFWYSRPIPANNGFVFVLMSFLTFTVDLTGHHHEWNSKGLLLLLECVINR